MVLIEMNRLMDGAKMGAEMAHSGKMCATAELMALPATHSPSSPGETYISQETRG